ncbi:MAG: hypothetical protein Q7T76_09270 [Ferruginibacter sp.]|nr:hypothetical protein [Ferruginibacter sp.]
MTEETKITLSPKELDLVCNTDWILTKQAIIAKVYDLFGMSAEKMTQMIKAGNTSISSQLGEVSPKIARGENYQQLPYVILDYPRIFGKENTLAIRTMFWWGNFFSVTLQLSGSYKARSTAHIIARFHELRQRNYWICIHPDPWQHHFEEDNYVQLGKLKQEEFADILQRNPFLKMAIKWPLSDWSAVPTFIEESFKEMIGLIETSYPGGEKGLSPGIPTTDFGL